MLLFRFSWKWRRRSPGKVKEGTHEKATELNGTIRRQRRSPSSGGICWRRNPSQSCAMKWDMQPTVFYRWQKEFFENGAAAFEQKAVELMAEHVALKKDIGAL
jgi:hypothetical protein